MKPHNFVKRFATRWRRLMLVAVLATAALLTGSPTAGQSEEAHQQFLFGYKLLQRGDMKLAGEAFEKFLTDYPQDMKRGDALYYRALIAQRTQDKEYAAQLLKNVPKTEHVPAFAVDLLRAQVHSDRGEFDHALAALERIDLDEIKEDKIKASVYQLSGRAYRAMGNLPGAATALRKAANIDSPFKGRALVDLARVHAMRGQHEAAIDALDECIKLNDIKHVPEAARLAGDQSYKRGKYPDAIKYYNTVISRFQTTEHFGPSVVGLMWAQFTTTQHDAVIKTYELHKDNLELESSIKATYLAGSAHLEKKNFKQAAALLGSIVERSSGMSMHDEVLYKKAVAHFENEEYDDMTRALTVMFKSHPESKLNLDGQFLLAAADAKAGRFKQGIDRLTAIIEFRGKHPYHDQALLQRAELYQQNDQPAEAVDDYLRYFALPGKIDDQGRFTDHETVLRLLDLQFHLDRFDAVEKTTARLALSGISGRIERDAMYRRALALLRLDRKVEAAQTLTGLIDKYPDAPIRAEWLYYRGLLRVTSDQREAGLKDLRTAAESSTLSQGLRANALRMTSIALRDANKNDEAAEVMLQLKKYAGLTADEMFWLARHFVATQQSAKAIEFLEPLLKSDRTSESIRANARFLAGKCYHEAKRYDEAAEVFEALIAARHPYTTQARLAVARVYRDKGDEDKALAQYKKLSASQTSRIAAEALFDTAMIYLDRAKRLKLADDAKGHAAALAEAESRLMRITVLFSFANLSPLPESSYIELAGIYEQRDERNKMQQTLSELIEKFELSPHATYAKALLKLDARQRADAVYLLKTLIDQKELLEPRLLANVENRLKLIE